MLLMGTYTPKLDEKGRLFLPAKFRDQLAEGVVVTQGQEQCLVVWPSDVFATEAARTAAESRDSLAARQRQRVLFSGADEVKPDKQGRIGVTGHLRAYAGLERDVVVIGVMDKLEIWDPRRWSEFADQATTAFSTLDVDATGTRGD